MPRLPNNANQRAIWPGIEQFLADPALRARYLQMHGLANEQIIPKPVKKKEKNMPKYKIFWGGADVDPSLYNRPKSNYCGHTNANTDRQEADEMQKYIDAGIPIIAICRGAQLLNVVNGGILVQHIEDHAIRGEHACTIDNVPFNMGVSSTHHQMMVAHKDGKVLGKSMDPVEGVHWDNVNESYLYNFVNEVIYYPKTKSLCIQPHPEWMDQASPFVHWINEFIKKEFKLDPIDFRVEEHRAAFVEPF